MRCRFLTKQSDGFSLDPFCQRDIATCPNWLVVYSNKQPGDECAQVEQISESDRFLGRQRVSMFQSIKM